jgi:periodic tryptophan protein 2
VLVNVRRNCLLHRMAFKAPVAACRFSPDGALFAVCVGKLLQVRVACPGVAGAMQAVC